MEETTGLNISTDFLFLADKLSNDKRKEFLEYRKYILEFPNLNLAGFHIGYFEQNIKIAEMIPKDKIVIDVGCGFGFQHILYQGHEGWLGIQEFLPFNASPEPELKVFVSNAKIIKGKFENVWQSLGITEENKNQYFGIANHSLWHDPLRNKEDIEIFKRLFPVNHYATDTDSKQVLWEVENNLIKNII